MATGEVMLIQRGRDVAGCRDEKCEPMEMAIAGCSDTVIGSGSLIILIDTEYTSRDRSEDEE